MNFDNYLFRAHMVGKIVDVPKPLTERQNETLKAYKGKGYENLTTAQKKTFANLENKLNESKTYKLTDSTKNLLSELVFAHKYGRKVDINSSKLKKGIQVEKDSRDILSRVSGLFLTACNERKNNDYVTGAIDVSPDNGVIIDIKSTYSWTSFCKILQSKPNEIYLRQGDSYMDLWGIDSFLLCHVLTNTPFEIIDKELRSADYSKNILNIEGEVNENHIDDVVKIVTNHLFTREALESYCNQSSVVEIEWFSDFKEIPEKERVHMIPHSFDKVRIEQRNKCIELARKYMNTVTPINNYQPQLLTA